MCIRDRIYTGLALFGMQMEGSAALLDTPTIQVLQYLMVLAGTAGSIYTAYRIAGSRLPKNKLIGTWAPIAALIAILGAVNLLLFYLPMEMRM